jgi:type I restriction enzyme S subunit
MSFPRYPEYKDSGVEWVDEVPAKWAVVPLCACAIERDDGNHGLREDNLLSLSYGKIVRKNIASNDGLLPASFETYQIVQPNDIVLRLTDLQNDQRSLRSALVREKGIITSAYTTLAPTHVYPPYLAYLLRAYDIAKVFYSMGGGLRQSIGFEEMRRLPLLLPSDREQHAIAAYLDRETAKIDALVAEQERLIALLQEKRQAVISHAVTKGLNPDAPMKDSGVEWLGEVPAHWEIHRVKTISAFRTSGPRGWAERVDQSGALFIQSGDFNESLGVNFSGANRVAVVVDTESARTQLRNGDVLICITGAKTGNVAICEGLKETAFVNQHICIVRPGVNRPGSGGDSVMCVPAPERYRRVPRQTVPRRPQAEGIRWSRAGVLD